MTEIPERWIHEERLKAIRDWDHPKYSTGVHVSRDETVQMAGRVITAEARIRELETQLQEMRLDRPCSRGDG